MVVLALGGGARAAGRDRLVLKHAQPSDAGLGEVQQLIEVRTAQRRALGRGLDLDQPTFAGHHSDAALLGIFNVSVLHNLVHLAFGVAGTALARTFNSARRYLNGGGIVYLVLFIYGLVIDHDGSANFVPVNGADNWLHLGLAVAMIALGAALGRTREDTGQPVGTGSKTQGSTPHGPAL